MIGARLVLAAGASIVMIALVLTFADLTLGDAAPGGLWSDIAAPLIVIAAGVGMLILLVLVSSLSRIRNRKRREMRRYQLVLSQADEATFEQTAAAYDQLVQVVRASVLERWANGQPWLALESWFIPPRQEAETGTVALMLLCESRTQGAALAALRRAYPDLKLRADADGRPLEFDRPAFRPGHVLRVRKARSWVMPIGGGDRPRDDSNARSTIADIIRQQQQLQRLSCVRWCILPSADHLDSSAADRLTDETASRGNAQLALRAAGGAMSFLELQAAVERRAGGDARGRSGKETFSGMQRACRKLLSPALSQRGANHFTERLMWLRQRLYCRRWATGEPPLLPSPSGSTLLSPRELAGLMALPSLGSEHALPVARSTVPNLPIPPGVPRARMIDLPMPLRGSSPLRESMLFDSTDGESEIVDAEIVDHPNRGP